MVVYAELPGRRARQVSADLLMASWCLLWAWLGRIVFDAVLALTNAGEQLQQAGSGFAARMSSAADNLMSVPLIGDQIASPFRSAAATGGDLEQVGTELVTSVEQLAALLGWLVALVPVVVVGAVWLTVRIRFVRRATAARTFRDRPGAMDLLALRALVSQPMAVLNRIGADPSGAWRRGDVDVILALGALELRGAGLRATPAVTRTGSAGSPT